MKVLLLIAVVAVLLLVLFVVGLFSPPRSRRIQGGVDALSQKAERKAGQKAGWFGDTTRGGLRFMRRMADKGAKKGREAHDDLTSWGPG